MKDNTTTTDVSCHRFGRPFSLLFFNLVISNLNNKKGKRVILSKAVWVQCWFNPFKYTFKCFKGAMRPPTPMFRNFKVSFISLKGVGLYPKCECL